MRTCAQAHHNASSVSSLAQLAMRKCTNQQRVDSDVCGGVARNSLLRRGIVTGCCGLCQTECVTASRCRSTGDCIKPHHASCRAGT